MNEAAELTPYTGDAFIHDADAHIIEEPDWMVAHADPGVREKLKPVFVASVKPGEESMVDVWRRRHAEPARRSKAEAEIMLTKNWSALGSFIAQDRPRALDLLGFRSQLVFNTFTNDYLYAAEHKDDLEFAYGLARAHNRAMVEFCSVDPRLLATAYVPLADFEQSRIIAQESIRMGAKALLVASGCPKGHSPSHTGLFPVWAMAQEAGLPVVFHVGGGGKLLDPAYFENGLPPVPDFHGGAENFRSVDYMAIPYPPMQTLATMIFDRVFDHFPRLKVGVIEQGAVWVPGWMRSMDTSFNAFRRNEERLQKLELLPSEYVRRQIRVTPYPAEPVGWIIEQAGEEVCLFSSDWPHVEGGRNPIRRFESSLEGISARARASFYKDNFIDLMGQGLAGVPAP
ncbi:MAG: amidohydrolase family protein [Candidatus Binatia bacterium]|nr:amidohydrolase family protein [Candidatus Binatia bacterium]